MKKRAVLCLLLACAMLFSLCLASCGGGTESDGENAGQNGGNTSGNGGSAQSEDNVYTIKMNDSPMYGDAENARLTLGSGVFSIEYENEMQSTAISGVSVDGVTEVITDTGIFERAGEDTGLLTVTGANLKYVTADEAKKQEILDRLYSLYPDGNDRNIAAFGENGYSATDEELAYMAKYRIEIRLVKSKKTAVMIKRYDGSGLDSAYEYDSELRMVRETTQTGTKEYSYAANGELAGYKIIYTYEGVETLEEGIVTEGVPSVTHQKKTVNGTVEFDYYYDEYGNIIEE